MQKSLLISKLLLLTIITFFGASLCFAQKSESRANFEKAVIEFNIGDKEDMDNTFMLHVRGGQDPTGEIAKLCKQHDWIAYDISGEQFIDNTQPTKESFKEWESYRDHVVLGETNKKPWWKFW